MNSPTIDYKKAEQFVRDVMEGLSIKLIKKLALNICKNFFAPFTEPQKLTARNQEPRLYPKTLAAFVQIVPTWTPS